MTDINQAILISSITVITIVLAIIGIQVALIFREIRHSIKKINKILDDVGNISSSVSRTIHDLGAISKGFQVVGKLLRSLGRRKRKENDE